MDDAVQTPPRPMADPIVVALRAQIDAASGGGAALIGGGAVVCLLSSALVALVMVLLMNLWFSTSVIGFFGWTLLGLLACGGYIAWKLKKPPVIPDGTLNYTHGVPADGVLGESALDYPLIGPRMVMAGARLAKPAPDAATEHFYDRCALLLRQMARHGEAMPAAQLLIGDDETPHMLDKVIGYLDRQNWLGASSDRNRVWLSAHGQAELRRLGVLQIGSAHLGGTDRGGG